MQNIGLLFLAILLSFTGCNGGEGQLPTKEVKQEENPIHGTWQLQKIWLGNVGDLPPTVSEFSDEYYLVTFKINNTFSSNIPEFRFCQDGLIKGNFSLGVDDYDYKHFVELSYPCASIDKKRKETIKYSYSFENEYLFLSPLCPEGCSYRFKRVSDP